MEVALVAVLHAGVWVRGQVPAGHLEDHGNQNVTHKHCGYSLLRPFKRVTVTAVFGSPNIRTSSLSDEKLSFSALPRRLAPALVSTPVGLPLLCRDHLI